MRLTPTRASSASSPKACRPRELTKNSLNLLILFINIFIVFHLEQVGMTDCSDRQIGSLSGGERQRVYIARSLAFEAQILLLDQPTANVDPNRFNPRL